MTTSTTTTTPANGTAASTDRIFNFSAGPAVLPETVLRQARADLWNIADSGIGVLEHSHRGAVISRVLDEAEQDCRRIAGISDDYHVLFLQGGATLQFTMVPMNFLGRDRTADYIDTGIWTNKAIKDARVFGKVNIAFDGSAGSYDHVPEAGELKLSADAAYTYYCSNNTVYGTQYADPPASSTPLVCDASSDIFSRPIDIAAHAVIFAGAQKNLGPAGCTLVIIRKDLLDRANDGLPAILDYRQHADKGSRLNTPPVFGFYAMGLVFKWILAQGGLDEIAGRNRDKAKLVYDAINISGGFYRPVARTDSRSLMNVTFRTPDESLDTLFVEQARRHGMAGLKGHRSVGGLRASIYNAFPAGGCEALASFMREFAATNG
ncbi:MAG: 3-phosphoserine/phosphohydroxythreonine transaminase [Planctomycetes bacterium]|nr:3-phosphoserine/phosphohydroxythreonine transaminase [Planctomycetota bacterium]